jgi:hypothetical protein
LSKVGVLVVGKVGIEWDWESSRELRYLLPREIDFKNILLSALNVNVLYAFYKRFVD